MCMYVCMCVCMCKCESDHTFSWNVAIYTSKISGDEYLCGEMNDDVYYNYYCPSVNLIFEY